VTLRAARGGRLSRVEGALPGNRQGHVVIVGGGITGLSAAYALRGRARVTLLELEARLGGKLVTERLGSPLGSGVVDGGAESFITRKPEAYQLALELGLEAELLDPGAETKGVFLWRDGGMREVPTSPPALMRSSLLSWAGKWRLLREPFTPPAPTDADESLFAFLERRLGREAAQTFAPVMAGIYSTDPRHQSLNASFPILRELEREGGSLVRGMLKRRSKTKAQKTTVQPPRAISFRNGVGTLIDALEAKLRSQPNCEVRLNARVAANFERADTQHLRLESGEVLTADAVILACPAPVSASLLEGRAPDTARALRALRHSSIGTLALQYPTAALEAHRDVRGLMIPRTEGRVIDAVLFTGFKMPSRVTGETTLLRVFFGAARPDLVTMPEAELLEVVRSELRATLGLEAQPLAWKAFRWAESFPSLEVGHLERVAAAERVVPNGVLLAGASYYGLGVPDCVRQGRDAAERALRITAKRSASEVTA
jgi:protoporphyrinogen/coproporphyrinogen III oxidase